MTSVLVADDQTMVRSGLRLILELRGFDVVGEAADGAEAAEAAVRLRPDVVLMDVRMPNVDGVEGTRRIVAADLPTRVLMLTTFDLDRHVYDALHAGAAGFLLKDASADRLVAAIEGTLAGEAPLAPQVMSRMIDRFLQRRPPAGPDSAGLASLTPREREVLRLMARGLTNAEISDHLVLSMATVKSHVRSVLAKSGARDRVHAVLLAHEHGLADG
ncbi:response regulator [Nocardioides sp. SYSU DS0663]|uniref:response regulator n=1 Tax=Nocardioides sp. SYSU DS0663 TaxID=3416445 RepID=UPI003F4B4D9B